MESSSDTLSEDTLFIINHIDLSIIEITKSGLKGAFKNCTELTGSVSELFSSSPSFTIKADVQIGK